jgi:hypothetical protein
MTSWFTDAMAGQVLPHLADRDRSAWATDERQREMVFISKQETAGAPTCCHAAR